MSFKDEVLDPLRAESGRQIKVPSQVQWNWDSLSRTVQLTVSTDVLCGNFQAVAPASPAFAVAVAAALERVQASSVQVHVQVDGQVPTRGNRLLHFRRSLFLLSTYAELLPRFTYDGPPWTWPADPVMHGEGDRRNRKVPTGGEALLEHRLAGSASALAAFSEAVEPISRFETQLPLGLFEGSVSAATEWTVRSKSAVDMWAEGADVMHLFELKVPGNQPLGILPEALYYARMLDAVRRGRVRVPASAVGGNVARRASGIVMWLCGADYHPLVCHPAWGAPVLDLLNGATTDTAFRILPLDGGITAPAFRWP